VASSIGHNQRAISRVVQSASGAQPRMRVESSVRARGFSSRSGKSTRESTSFHPEYSSKVFELSPMRARRLQLTMSDDGYNFHLFVMQRKASGASFIITASAIGVEN